MDTIDNGTYIELIPKNTYLTDLEETDVYKRICGKNINPDDYKDITDEEAEIIIKRNEESTKSEEGVGNNE